MENEGWSFSFGILQLCKDWWRTWEKSGELWGLGDLNQPLQEITAPWEEWQSRWLLVSPCLAPVSRFGLFLCSPKGHKTLGQVFRKTRVQAGKSSQVGAVQGQRVGLGWGFPPGRCWCGEFCLYAERTNLRAQEGKSEHKRAQKKLLKCMLFPYNSLNIFWKAS